MDLPSCFYYVLAIMMLFVMGSVHKERRWRHVSVLWSGQTWHKEDGNEHARCGVPFNYRVLAISLCERLKNMSCQVYSSCI